MIDFIASKKANGKGQLEELDDISVIQAFTGKLFRDRDKNDNYRVLIVNQYADIKSILELASLNLILSSDQMVKKLSQAIYLTDDSNAKEAIAIAYLMNSIIYYNASFDYLKLLIRISFSCHDEFIKDFPKDKVETKINKFKEEFRLKNIDWIIVIREIISKIDPEKFNKWLKSALSNSIIEKYNELQNLNKDLRHKYQANQLKHRAMPHFRRSDPGNAIGVRCFISMEQFYNKENKQSFSFGFPLNSLNVDKTQDFLIEYNNKTVEVIRELKLTEMFAYKSQ